MANDQRHNVVRQSRYFLPIRKEDPRDEEFTNAKLLIRGGFIEKLHAGVYTFLPLGLRVLRNIEAIIREEMEALGAHELLMPALHPKAPWEQTGRWKTLDILYRLQDSSGKDFALGPTHEEIVVPLVKRAIVSYRDLPLALYQFQTKFRDEPRPKSGLLRGREFLMKDLYSFHRDEADLNAYYDRVRDAYTKIFTRIGVGDRTYLTYASGGSFSKYSHEFQALSPAGEDTIFLCENCRVAVNAEIIDEQPSCPSCGRERAELRKERAIEVGNIFPLKTKFSEAFGLLFRDADGREELVCMGCYGIGLGRVMAAIVEIASDERGIRWPQSVAPFLVHLLALGGEGRVFAEAEKTAAALQEAGIPVLYDDRNDISAGEKFATADLIGIPWRIVVSPATIDKGVLEVKARDADSPETMSLRQCIARISPQ